MLEEAFEHLNMARPLLPLPKHGMVLVWVVLRQLLVVGQVLVAHLDKVGAGWLRGAPAQPDVLAYDHVAPVWLAAHIELAAAHEGDDEER